MRHEKGAAMIIVLVVLLLVAIAGAIAMRSGIFGSRLSLNSQISGLLRGNSDSALAKFEDMPRDEVMAAFAVGGVYDRLLQPAHATDELVFCYNASKPDTFAIANAQTITDPTNPSANHSAAKFCKKDSYSSGRQTDITQIHLKRNNDTSSIPEGFTISATMPSVDNRINVSLVSISVMPKSASQDVSNELDGCFAKSAFDKEDGSIDTISECLSDNNIPHEVQRTDYESGNKVTAKAP